MNAAVFVSGNGSNFEAIIEGINRGELHASIKLLVCDRNDAYAIKRAEKYQIPTLVFQPKEYLKKADYEEMIAEELERHKVDFVILAGYMRLIGETLLKRYKNRMINIHPSLLPSFPGLDAVGQALEAGVKVTGVTIHFVDEGMDTGPIIAQEAIRIEEKDTKEDVQRKIQRIEHTLYPKTIQSLIKNFKEVEK